jgi:hypothetical protein
MIRELERIRMEADVMTKAMPRYFWETKYNHENLMIIDCGTEIRALCQCQKRY